MILELSPLVKGEGTGVLSAKGYPPVRLRAVGVRSHREEIGVPFSKHTRLDRYYQKNCNHKVLIDSTVPYFFQEVST